MCLQCQILTVNNLLLCFKISVFTRNAMESSDELRKKQQEFWIALIKKYEKRNFMLEQQILSLQTGRENQIKSSKDEIQLSRQGSTCSCTPCLARSTDDEYNKSVFSLSSTDVEYISQIKDLVERQKEMKQKLMGLQQEGLHTEEKVFKECRCDEITGIKNALLEENIRLTEELKNLKLEMSQCMEKIKGPIARQIEKEKSKNKCLENELVRIQKDSEKMQQNLISESKELKCRLSAIQQEVSLMSALNNKLEEELRAQTIKCKELEEALINEKLAEAEILKKLKDAQEPPTNPSCSCPPCQPPPPPSSCICPCVRRKCRGGGDNLKKQSTVPSEELKRFIAQSKKQNQLPNEVDKIKSLSKSTESNKVPFTSCKCQTQMAVKESAKIQAEPQVLDATASATVEKAETKLATDDTTVENTTTMDEIDNQETAAEAVVETTDYGTDAVTSES